MRNYDQQFLKRFSMVIGFLVLLTIGLIIFASHLHTVIPQDPDPVAVQRIDARIAPIGAVYAGEPGRVALAAAEAAAAAAASAQVAYGGTTDGAVIFERLCGACHASGTGGAPTLDHSHWDARIAQGTETLYKHAMEGFTGAAGVMPAKGGNAALTEEQVHATVDWMIANLK